MSTSAKELIVEVFTKAVADQMWTSNTLLVLPLTPQNFAVGSVLPAVFYMCRRACRRGKGRFQTTFSPAEGRRADIYSVAGKLSQDSRSFSGFSSEVTKDILGDLLLCDQLENKGHAEGHREEIQRAFPVHFFASWLDLPLFVGNLRFVPEMIVCLLANQHTEQRLHASVVGSDSAFPVGRHPQNNLFFRIFGRGVNFGENTANLCTDAFDESSNLSIEELLMIRLAIACEEAPETARPSHNAVPYIQNIWPISQRATTMFRTDITNFLQSYGEAIPRRSITPMLESLLGLALLCIYMESCSIAVTWEQTGDIPSPTNQVPVSIFADASNGSSTRLRDLSEQSFEECVRLLDQAMISLAQIRILSALLWDDPDLVESKPKGPDTSTWLKLLAQVRKGRHDVSALTLRDVKLKNNRLADKLEAACIEPDAIDILRSTQASQEPVQTAAEALCAMMGEKLLRTHHLKFLDSCLMVNEPHGLGRKRRVSRNLAGRKRKMMDVRSAILSNTVLETLVHLHLVGRQGVLSYGEFLRILRERYGIWVDECPPGVAASREDLLSNRAMLERRLRDLGLLVGVNDAEFMKHLRPRFKTNPQP